MAKKAPKGRGKKTAKRAATAERVSPIPEGFHALTPYLAIRGAAQALEWYQTAFGAEEISRQYGPGGLILNAQLKIGDSRILLSDIFPGAPHRSPIEYGGSPVTLHIYTKDVDGLWDRAVAAGAKPRMPLADQFWGDRYGQLVDPFGHEWSVASRKEKLTPKEHSKRAAAWMAQFEKTGQPGPGTRTSRPTEDRPS